jgi:cytochrome c oxidase assembly factor CtaG
VYIRGVRASWRRGGVGRGVRSGQIAAFAVAIIALVVALLSPLDALAEQLFAAHMAQHVLLGIVAPPLLVLGAPQVAAIWAIPHDTRARTPRLFNRARRHDWWRRLTTPWVAALVSAATLWAWHVPRPFEAELANPALHAIEHATLVGGGVLLWWSVLHGRAPRRVSYGVGIGTLFFTMLHGTVLGALITLSDRPWYPAQSHGAIVWGLTPLADQQMAGFIMWVVAGLLQLIAVGAVFFAWMRACASSAPAGKWSRSAHAQLAQTR